MEQIPVQLAEKTPSNARLEAMEQAVQAFLPNATQDQALLLAHLKESGFDPSLLESTYGNAEDGQTYPFDAYFEEQPDFLATLKRAAKLEQPSIQASEKLEAKMQTKQEQQTENPEEAELHQRTIILKEINQERMSAAKTASRLLDVFAA